MRFNRTLPAVALICFSTSGLAQQIVYNGATGLVTIPSVQVGADVYVNVSLRLTGTTPTLTFALNGATLGTPGSSALATYNLTTQMLALPGVQVGNDRYNATLQNTGNFNFRLASADLLPPPTTGNASACFDQAYLATGTKWELFQQTSTSGVVVSTNKVENEILGPKTFNGQSSIEEKTQLTILTGTGAGTTSESRSYFQVQPPKVLTLGAFTQIASSGFTTETTTVFNPPTEFNYSLSAGQSVTTVATGTSTTQITGVPIGPQVSTFSYTITYTFLGFETVTVPAGTFTDACKWTYVTTTSGVTATSTHWMSKKGAPLKTVSGNDVTELMPGSNVNGGPVGP